MPKRLPRTFTVRFQLLLTEAQHEAVRRIAEAEDKSMGDVIREFIELGLAVRSGAPVHPPLLKAPDEPKPEFDVLPLYVKGKETNYA